jgi:uncharacterized membrane protein
MSARPLPMPTNPALLRHAEQRRKSLENRIADRITRFAGSIVMISQNRADEKRQVLADHQWQTVQQEEQQNEQLLQLSNQILELTRAIHAMDTARSPTGRDGTEQSTRSSIRNALGQRPADRSDGRA